VAERFAVDGNAGPRPRTTGEEGCATERHAPGSSNHCYVKADREDSDDDADCRALDGSSNCYVEAEGKTANDEAERRAVDGIDSPHTGANSAEGCAGECRAPSGNSQCCVEDKVGGTNNVMECRAVDGITSPRAGTKAGRAPGSSEWRYADRLLSCGKELLHPVEEEGAPFPLGSLSAQDHAGSGDETTWFEIGT